MKDETDDRGRLGTYLELVRLPNVFTAMADVAMGFLFVHAVDSAGYAWVLGLLMAASALLYAAGVALNDLFDLPLDTQERPDRPLPSGRISPAAAAGLGWGLLAAGVVAAAVAAVLAGDLTPAVVAVLLAGCIVAYDALLKRTPFGPPAMGLCRLLNVLMGMSVLGAAWRAEHWLVAGAIGIYVTGLTWLARTEARQSRRAPLAAATGVMALGIALLALLPFSTARVIPQLQHEPNRWALLMAVLGAWIVWRCVWAVVQPAPHLVQRAVGQAILSLVFLDAAACYAVRGPLWAAAILALLVPAMASGQWIRTT